MELLDCLLLLLAGVKILKLLSCVGVGGGDIILRNHL